VVESKIDDRKLDVLRAIVEDYVATEEPVGSRALVERHDLSVSSATIRNDMATLEDEGYITQPHTSAGRVPTDKGYRLFVDRLAEVKPLSPPERRAIQAFLDGAVDLDDVVSRTVRLLAQLTHQVAVVQYPSLTRSTVRHVELVTLAPTRLLIVVVTSTGRVEKRALETAAPVPDVLLGDLRARLNAAVYDVGFADVADAVADLPAAFEPESRPVASAVVGSLLDSLVERREERIVLGGTSNLVRFGPEFAPSIRPVLEALEESVVLLRLLGEATDDGALTVRIGHENEHSGLAVASVVASGYGPSGDAVAKLGVVGPTRMDYPGAMSSVRAVARYVGRILAGS